MRLAVLTVLVLVLVPGCRFGFDPDPDNRPGGDGGALDTPESARSCTGYQSIAGVAHTYRVLGTRDWLTAEQACEADGTHLAIVEDFGEEEAIRLHVGATAWLGTTDRVTEGTFLHVSGAAAMYTSWSTGTSNAGEDCASVLAAGKWEDQDCNISLAGVCECDDVGVVAGSY